MLGIGKRIREYRRLTGLKITELAGLLGISQGALSDIENEKTNPSAETINALVRNVDVNAEWLITGMGWTFSPSRHVAVKKRIESVLNSIEAKKIVIIAYGGDYYRANEREMIYSLVMETAHGTFSIEGLPVNKTGAVKGSLIDILLYIKGKEIPVFKIALGDKDVPDWDKVEIVSFLSSKRAKAVNIDNEISLLESPLHHHKRSEPSEKISTDVLEIVELLNTESGEFTKKVLKILRERRADMKMLDSLRNVRNNRN